ncbi:MAG TPA: hypothetical protein VFM05_12430 [Candidatus Saccharimonadales bacterium]|nr:hypothetical protein [Candidatus Saccharimonadales bacterium]
MTFNKKLPSIRTLRSLASIDGPFPIKNRHVILAAQRFYFNDNVVEFLRLFPRDQVFHSRDEFIERCQQLELLIQEERRAPIEVLHSPQG